VRPKIGRFVALLSGALLTTTGCGLRLAAPHGDSAPGSAVPVPHVGAHVCGAVDGLTAPQLARTDGHDELLRLECQTPRLVRHPGTSGLRALMTLSGATRAFDQEEASGTEVEAPSWWSPVRPRRNTGGVMRLDLEREQPQLTLTEPNGAQRVVALSLPGLKRRPLDGATFKDFCYARDVLLAPERYDLVGRVDLAAAADESQFYVMVATCGYVEIFALDETGALVWKHTLVDGQDQEPIALVPLQAAWLVGADGSVDAVAGVGTHWQDDDRTTRTRVTMKRWSAAGEELASRAFVPSAGRVAVAALDVVGSDVWLVGNAEKPIAGGANDTAEDDVWLAKVTMDDLAAAPREQMQDVQGDDLGRAIAVNLRGDVYVAAATGAHYVDTGSWDGGAKATVLRFDAELALQESIDLAGNRFNDPEALYAGDRNVLVAGKWDGLPNNHLDASEDWQRGFVATLPAREWHDVAPTQVALHSLLDLGGAAK
jgi:hypothetical protein